MNEKKPYHHRDLRNALIEKGIELVHSDGMNSFSLRKVAAACGVSHAAPYSHFRNKEELLDAMQLYVTDQFSEILENTIAKYENTPELLKHMGIAYVSFFVRNPFYFSFLYSQSNIQIELSESIGQQEKYKPLKIFESAVVSLLERAKYPKEKQSDVVIAAWALIHGITSLATMGNVHYNDNWEEKVIDFMRVFDCSFLNHVEG